MKIIFLLNFIITFLIFLILSITYFKNHNIKKLKKILNSCFFISSFYFILSVFSLVWFLNLLDYLEIDFLFIYSVLITLQTIFIFRIIYEINKNKNLFFIFFLYLFSFFSFFYFKINFFHIILLFSFLFLLLLFIFLLSKKDPYKEIIYSGIIYSSISILLISLILFKIGNLLFYSLISNILFLFFIYNFVKNLNKYKFHLNETKNKTTFFNFFRYFIFIITISNFVFIGTIGIHELGHFIISKLENCEFTKIIYEENYPYTQTICKDQISFNLFLIGGITLPIFLALFLFSVGGILLKEISTLILGFNFIISSKDLIDLGFSENIALVSGILGIFILIYGIINLTKTIVYDYFYLVID